MHATPWQESALSLPFFGYLLSSPSPPLLPTSHPPSSHQPHSPCAHSPRASSTPDVGLVLRRRPGERNDRCRKTQKADDGKGLLGAPAKQEEALARRRSEAIAVRMVGNLDRCINGRAQRSCNPSRNVVYTPCGTDSCDGRREEAHAVEQGWWRLGGHVVNAQAAIRAAHGAEARPVAGAEAQARHCSSGASKRGMEGRGCAGARLS